MSRLAVFPRSAGIPSPRPPSALAGECGPRGNADIRCPRIRCHTCGRPWGEGGVHPPARPRRGRSPDHHTRPATHSNPRRLPSNDRPPRYGAGVLRRRRSPIHRRLKLIHGHSPYDVLAYIPLFREIITRPPASDKPPPHVPYAPTSHGPRPRATRGSGRSHGRRPSRRKRTALLQGSPPRDSDARHASAPADGPPRRGPTEPPAPP
jgi:hypothetical protein